MKKQKDDEDFNKELVALKTVVMALNDLNNEARSRVMEYIHNFFDVDEDY